MTITTAARRRPVTRLHTVRRLTVLTVLLLLGLLAPASLPAGLTTQAVALNASRGYDGPCRVADDNGVTIVLDFRQLDGNDGRPAPTIVRCSPVSGNDPTIRRTGLQALVDAGIVVDGTQRWGDDYPTSVPFVCRIEGRPAADEPIHLAASDSTYREGCGDTPPGDAYWSYWHADGQGGDWTYAALGVMNRNVVPGGFEGWSFALNTTFGNAAAPRVNPINPNVPATLTLTANRTDLDVGGSATLTWQATGVSHLVASGAWNGSRLAEGTETVTPPGPGTYTYTLTTAGSERPVVRSVSLTVIGDDTSPVPPTPTPTPASSAAARQTASWLVNELSPAGQMPGPTGGTDWGLTIDTLWALHAVGTGARASGEIVTQIQRHAGEYLGPDLFGDADARIGGSTAKLLVAAVVAGKDPEAFGTGRFIPAGTSYDLRADTLALLESSGPQRGRITNRGTGNTETNVFAQSLAVIGLARSGGVPDEAVDFLVTQQCRAGFFRMFYPDGRTCDAAAGVGDPDGTAMAVQAMMTARDNGIDGLDDRIDRALDWLLSRQGSNGSFGGGVGTSTANSNSTGLVAQTLATAAEQASGARASRLRQAYEQARDWLLTVHVRDATARGSRLVSDREHGAIAYDRAAFARAKENGIGATERDQWRRATAQAVLGLAPVSFADLGTVDLSGDPQEQNRPGPTDKDNGTTPPAVPPDITATTPVVPPSADSTSPTGATTAAGRLGDHLAGLLVDGDHIEVVADGHTYVDYDATADVWFALRALGDREETLKRVGAFLLHRRSIDAYAHGVPYDGADAAYAEPLAKLALIARQNGTGPKVLRSLRSLQRSLDALEVDASGRVSDVGTYADQSQSTTRQAWLLLAHNAADSPDAPKIARRLLDGDCEDGLFPATLTTTPCLEGDPAATAVATEALNSIAAPSASTTPGSTTPAEVEPVTANTPPLAWSTDGTAERPERIEGSALAALTAIGPNGLPLADPADNGTTAAYARIRQATGLSTTATATAMVARQRDDGAFATTAARRKAPADLSTTIAMAPVLTGHGWIGLPDSPLVTAVHLPLVPNPAAKPTPATTTAHPSTRRLVGLAAGSGLLGLVIGVGLGRFRREGSQQ